MNFATSIRFRTLDVVRLAFVFVVIVAHYGPWDLVAESRLGVSFFFLASGFLMQTDERIIPIEVKAEENTKSKSLNGFVNVDHADKHLKALRCSMLPYADQGWMENIPLYSVLAYFSDLAE